MVLRTVNLSDTIDQWKNQHNSLATDVGDLSLLNTTDSSSIVAAINSLIGEFDSANIITLARNSLSASSGITYDSSTGVIGLSIPANTITFTMMADSSVGTSELRNNSVTFAKMADSSVGSNELRQAVQLIIYNSAGSAVKSLYGAGE